MTDPRTMTIEDRAIYRDRGFSYDAYELEVQFNNNHAAETAFFLSSGGVAKCVASSIEEILKVPGAAEKSWRIY